MMKEPGMTELRYTLADCILIDLELEDYDQLMTYSEMIAYENWLEALNRAEYDECYREEY
jgi:hypothetical protein